MKDDEQGKKATRSPRIPGHGRRPTITFRCRGDIQASLQSAAEKGDRSLSEEIERRLERSFEDARLQEMIAGHMAKEARAEAISVVSKVLGGDENLLAVHRFAAQYAVLAARIRAEKQKGDEARTIFGERCAEAARAVGTEAFEMWALLEGAGPNDRAHLASLESSRRVEDLLANLHEESDPRSTVEKAERRVRTDLSGQ